MKSNPPCVSGDIEGPIDVRGVLSLTCRGVQAFFESPSSNAAGLVILVNSDDALLGVNV